VESFEIVATALFEELHVTDATCSVLLSLKVPVATNCSEVSRGIVVLAGATAMETRFAGVNVAGSYNSALASGTAKGGLPLPKFPPLRPPATSTSPVVRKTALWNTRPLVRLPVRENVPNAGSKTSALVKIQH
jgi:hypothetical protein